jgi:MFS family permease
VLFSSLRHRNYRVFFVGTAISSVGNWVHRIAQDWLVLELTNNSAQALGIVVSAQFMPGFFFSLFSGSLADRFDRRKALLACNAFAGSIAVGLGVIVLLGRATVIEVALTAFLLGTCTAIDGPIRQSYYVILVGEKDLSNALSLNSANINIGRLVGPILSGILIQFFGTGPSFIVNAATYLVVLGTLFLIKPSQYQLREQLRELGPSTRMRAGLTHVLRKPELYIAIFAVSFLAMWGQDMQITSAMMAKDTFGRSAASFGILGSTLALGAILGSLVFARKETLPTVRVIGFRALMMAGAWFLASAAPNFQSYAVALFVCGYFAMGVNISGNGSTEGLGGSTSSFGNLSSR